MGKDREELEEGVRRVERALKLGFSDRVRALKVLESAHNAFVAEVARSKDEARSHLLQLQAIFRELARLEPNRPEWGMALSSTVLSEKEQIAVLRGVSARFPGYWPAVSGLSSLLCRGKHSAEVAQLVRAAASRTGPLEVEGLEGEMLSAAWRCGGEADADRIRSVLDARRRR